MAIIKKWGDVGIQGTDAQLASSSYFKNHKNIFLNHKNIPFSDHRQVIQFLFSFGTEGHGLHAG